MHRHLAWTILLAAPIALFTFTFAARPAGGQEPAPQDVTCRSFVVDTTAVYGAREKGRERLLAASDAHAAEVERWPEERAAAGQHSPVYRSSVSGVTGLTLQSEVVCVR
jgi:hypothetical protein